MTPFAIGAEPIDAQALRRSLEAHAAGACLCFEGWVRDHHDGRAVLGLEYEAYTALAEAEGRRVVEEAMQRFDLVAAACVHRVGRLALGDMAVWVGVSAAHRDAAFAGCRYIIDEVKRRVPIWKRETYADGEAGWLHPDEGAPPR